MRRILIVLVVALLALCVVAQAEDYNETYQMYVFCKLDDYVNARIAPSTKAEVMGRLDCGDVVETDGETKRDKKGRLWIKIYGFEANEAWVCASYLQSTEVVVAECKGYVSTNGRVALRKTPNGERIKWLNVGDEVTILAMSDEWALTTKGYVSRECLDVEVGTME